MEKKVKNDEVLCEGRGERTQSQKEKGEQGTKIRVIEFMHRKGVNPRAPIGVPGCGR